MTHAWAMLARLTGSASGWTMNSTTPAAMNGTTWATEIGVERQLADLLGLALAGRDHREIAAVELLAEGPHGGLDGLGIVGRPFGQRRVAGLVHANQTGHAQLPPLSSSVDRPMVNRAGKV